MKTGSLSLFLLCGLLATFGPSPLTAQSADAKNPAVPVFTAPAQDSTQGKSVAAGVENEASKTKPPIKATSLSPGLDEIVKLKKAGTDDSVLLTFIENSTIAYHPSAEEILQLRESGIPAPIIVAILKRGGELRQRAVETAAQP